MLLLVDSRRAAPIPEPEAVTLQPLFSFLGSLLCAAEGGGPGVCGGMVPGGTVGCSEGLVVCGELKGLVLSGVDGPLLLRSGR